MKNRLFFAAALAALALVLGTAGCHSHIYTGGEPDLRGASAKDSAYVERGEVYIGMPTEYVRASLGPARHIEYADDNRQRWSYRMPVYGAGAQDYTTAVLYFQNGELAGTRYLPGRYMR